MSSVSSERIADVAATPWLLQVLGLSEARSSLRLWTAADPERPVAPIDIRGPRCAYARTVEATCRWQKSTSSSDAVAYVAEVFESCLWAPVHPFQYAANLAVGDRREQALFGLRKLAIASGRVKLNGEPFRFFGAAEDDLSEARLRELHAWGCNLLVAPRGADAAMTDRWGPFIVDRLSRSHAEALAQARCAGPLRPSVGVWILPDHDDRTLLTECRRIDPSTLYAIVAPIEQRPPQLAADLAILSGTLESLERSARDVPYPWIAAVREAPGRPATEKEWAEIGERMESLFADLPGQLGWIWGFRADG